MSDPKRGLRTDTVFFEDRRPPPPPEPEPEPEPDQVATAPPAPDRHVAARRRSPRFTYRAVVEVARGPDVRSGAVRDLSEVGAFVAMPMPFPVDAEVGFALPLPTGSVPIRAKVVWSRASADLSSAEPGMGLDFVDLGPSGQERLVRVLTALARVGARARAAESDPTDFDLLDPDDGTSAG